PREGLQVVRRVLSGREDSPEYGGEVGKRARVEGKRHREGDGRTATADRKDTVQEPGEHGGDDRAQSDEEGLHGETARALLGGEEVGDEGTERLHADVDG